MFYFVEILFVPDHPTRHTRALHIAFSTVSGCVSSVVSTSVRLVGGVSGTSAELVGTSVRLVAG